MQKIILTKNQIQDLVSKNRYSVNENKKFISRCIDGRYPNVEDLPALAFPGGDVGELALIQATANAYGFEVDLEKVLVTIIEIVGGVENFGIHTDHHGDPKKAASGCGHLKQIILDPQAYKLEKIQVEDIQKKLNRLKKKKINEVILEGDHLEGAVLIVSGNWGIMPRYLDAQVFVYHRTLIDKRHQALCKLLVENKAVKLLDGCDSEYLYQVISEMAENHLMETVKRLANDLPIYEVEFNDDKSFIINQL